MNSPINTSENELAAIRQELNELRQAVGAMRSNGNGHHKGNGTSFLEAAESTALTDRRSMLKKVGAIAAGVAAAGLLRPTTARADDGNFLQFGLVGGTINREQHAAEFNYVGAATTSALFVFQDGTVYGPTDSAYPAALAGWASGGPAGSTVGVYGYTQHGSNGYGVNGVAEAGSTNEAGVFGFAATGIGGLFRGVRSAVTLGSGAGAVADPNVTLPSGGTVGDLYRGSTDGSLWYNAGGTNPYRRVADATTVGALTAFPASSRFVNLSLLNALTVNTYQIGGVTVSGNTVPAKARAIIARIADASPTGGGGNILVGATNPPVGGVLSVIVGAPQNSFFFSVLDATGKLYVENTCPSGSVQIIIDILGYYE